MRAIIISAIRGDKQILTVAETREGLRVISGDISLFERLGLAKYDGLDAIIRGIQRSSELSVTTTEIPGESLPQGSPKYLCPPETHVEAIRCQIKEMVSEGYTSEDILIELKTLGLERFPLEEMIASALGNRQKP